MSDLATDLSQARTEISAALLQLRHTLRKHNIPMPDAMVFYSPSDTNEAVFKLRALGADVYRLQNFHNAPVAKMCGFHFTFMPPGAPK